jgi:hypothetical protein
MKLKSPHKRKRLVRLHQPLLFVWGTSEHPEEPAYRCCLSALAGFGKYLPFLGAAWYYSQFARKSNLCSKTAVF